MNWFEQQKQSPDKERKKKEWKKFEERCLKLVHHAIGGEKFKIKGQYTRRYADGRTKRMDIYIAERRPGGRRYVLDCKHFPVATLNEREIQTTLEYKRRAKASKAFILISSVSNCPRSFLQSARKQGVVVVKVDTTWRQYVPFLKEKFEITL